MHILLKHCVINTTRNKITKTMTSCEGKKINGYCMLIKDLKLMTERTTLGAKAIPSMVPLATNYFENKIPIYTKMNNIHCTYYSFDHRDNDYHHSRLTVAEHINQKGTEGLDYVVLTPTDFEIIKQIVLTSQYYFHFGYHECIYDTKRSNVKTYTYTTKINNLVKLLDLPKGDHPQIDKLLSLNPIEIIVTGEKKDEPYLAEKYEVLYRATMTLDEHIRMYQRDQDCCNYNTVNHGISYEVKLSQEHYDLLTASMLSEDPDYKICLKRNLENTDTDAMLFFDKKMLFLASPEEVILNSFPALKKLTNSVQNIRQPRRDPCVIS